MGRPVWPTASSCVKAYSKGVLGCWGQHRPGTASQPAQLVHWHGCQLRTASHGLWGLLCRPASMIQAPVSALQAALLLLDLQLGICADKALQALADAEPAASLAADIAVCKSRAAFLCGREEGGAPAWQAAQQDCVCCLLQAVAPLPTVDFAAWESQTLATTQTQHLCMA